MIENSQLSNTKTIFVLKVLWRHVNRKHKSQLLLLPILMLCSSLGELVSLGAIIPFLDIINNPEKIKLNRFAQLIATRLNTSEVSHIIICAAVLFASTVVATALLRLINQWYNCYVAAAIGSDLSCKIYRIILTQPYKYYAKTNSSKLIKAITFQINETIVGINSILQIMTSSIIAVTLIAGIVYIDAKVAFGTAIILGGAYMLIGFTIRRKLLSNGRKITEASVKQLQSLQEGLGAIRDVILDGSQSYYLSDYKRYDRPQRYLTARNNFLSASPRFIIRQR